MHNDDGEIDKLILGWEPEVDIVADKRNSYTGKNRTTAWRNNKAGKGTMSSFACGFEFASAKCDGNDDVVEVPLDTRAKIVSDETEKLMRRRLSEI